MEELQEQLFSLAVEGDVEELQTFVNSVGNRKRIELINAQNDDGYTILHVAVENDHLPLLKWILSDSGGRAAGFDKILAQELMYRSTLHIAAINRNVDAFVAIVEGCKVENGERATILNTVDESSGTVLHVAAFCEATPIISWLLSDSGGRAAGFNKILATNYEGKTALHTAAYIGQEQFLAIVEGCKGENGERAEMLNALDDERETVLHQAIRVGSEDLVEWLLSEKGREAGFDPDDLLGPKDNQQPVLYFAAAFPCSKDCFDLIFDSCRNADDRSRLLFSAGENDYPLLHHAIFHNSVAAVEWVLSRQQRERGGSNEDIFALHNNKESVLHVAVGRGALDSFDVVLSRCNNTSERLRLFLGRDDQGWTIFHHAAERGRANFISHILQKYPQESKVIIDARDNRGMTALHRTIIGGIHDKFYIEWGFYLSNATREAVIVALLGFGEAVGADPNVGLKFE